MGGAQRNPQATVARLSLWFCGLRSSQPDPKPKGRPSGSKGPSTSSYESPGKLLLGPPPTACRVMAPSCPCPRHTAARRPCRIVLQRWGRDRSKASREDGERLAFRSPQQPEGSLGTVSREKGWPQ